MSSPFLPVAIEAVRRAGQVAIEHFGKGLHPDQIEHHDVKLPVDRWAEEAVISILRKKFPSHGILSEECGRLPGDEHTWVIDPVDGTVNYFHGVPHFSSSVALRGPDGTLAAAVLDPVRGELFSAEAGGGAFLNGKPIRVSVIRSLSAAVVAGGFVKDPEAMARNVAAMGRLVQLAQKVRVTGSVVLDLCWTAAGRFDGFYECGAWPWDVTGGALILEEAGGIAEISSFGTKGEIEAVASNHFLQRELLKVVRPG